MCTHIANRPVVCAGAVFLPPHYLITTLSFLIIVTIQILFIVVIGVPVGLGPLITASAMLVVVVALFATTTCCDPGIVCRPATSNLPGTAYLKYCPVCDLWRPPRCKHCRTCDNCIDQFDHHCFWLGNCIGRRNRRSFVLFLIAAALMLLVDMISGLFYAALTYSMLKASDPTRNRVRQLFDEWPVGSAVVIVVVVFWMMFSYMAIMNVLIAARGLTMVEYIKRTYARVRNPYDRGWIRNLWHLIRDPIPPSPFPLSE